MKALVLGGSGSIGTAIVERLLSDGYDVILHYYRSDIEDLREKYHGKSVSYSSRFKSKYRFRANIWTH